MSFSSTFYTLVLYFFFQAEDGIRGRNVTGVQTCALPIFPHTPAIFEMGDRTAIPPYDYENLRVVANDMPPIVRASWLRGVSALPNTFAHESWIDECADQAGVDPIEYRLRYLKDPRAVDLVNAVAERAGWKPRPMREDKQAEGDVVRGRGFAYALYVHSKFPGYG